MQKTILLSIFLALTMLLGGPAFAMDMANMDQAQRAGENIHNSMVDGYNFSYHLIDMKAKMQELKMDMPGMKSHHLMVYVGEMGKKPITDARVGYLITSASGQQQAMAMGMGDGYGADVDLKKGEKVTIKVKIMADGKQLVDEFEYTL